MEWLDALILGIVQGLAEYLPISSSGHLEIFRTVLGIDLPADKTLQFDVMVHAATVCSTIVILRHKFANLCSSFFTFRRDDDFYYVCKILVSCIPVGIVGVFFKDYVEGFFGSGLTWWESACASQPCFWHSPISAVSTAARAKWSAASADAT